MIKSTTINSKTKEDFRAMLHRFYGPSEPEAFVEHLDMAEFEVRKGQYDWNWLCYDLLSLHPELLVTSINCKKVH